MAQKQSTFLSLPGELRNRIYDLLLLYVPRSRGGDPNYIDPYTSGSSHDAPVLSYRIRLHPAIIATCKSIMSEALPTLYAGNTFGLWATRATYFTGMIGSQNAGLLRDVSIGMNGLRQIPEQLKLDQAFEHCAALKRFEISFEFILDPSMLNQNQQSVHDFLQQAQKWLAEHPSLMLAMSASPTGQSRHHSHFTWLEVICVAAQADYGPLGIEENELFVLDLDAIINELEDMLQKPVQQRKYPIQHYDSYHSLPR
ncbi:MAG: hypothetical protein Q9207_002553 [Kuettlingeria erythrocarpa]